MKPSFFHIPCTLYNTPNIVALTRALLYAYIMNIDKENYVVYVEYTEYFPIDTQIM